MNKFSIKDLENLTGIKAHTLRVWEQRHGIIIPKRTDTNIRYYDAEDLKKALKVSLLNKYGYKISRIQKMGDLEIDNTINQKADDDFKFENTVNKLLIDAVNMDTVAFEDKIDDYINTNGLEQTIEHLLFAFLDKVGLMWMTNRILPAQEHLTSNIISRKILLATEKLPSQRHNSKTPSFLLFLPEGEIHELALLYVHYLLRKHNLYPIYLGPDSPINDVAFVFKKLQPNYLYTHLTSVSKDFDVNKYLGKLTDACPSTNIFVSGSMLQKINYSSGNKDVVFLNTLKEVKEQIIYIEKYGNYIKH
ncbi:MAG: MerR family transcriptional regulator [Chitinophagales bacterium]|nr:MerR family transcriptional regulator [Chitinophagaceae bacterium]MCB9065545.1 MerR family transcriptional regulator [Chitinophagales bacterium]